MKALLRSYECNFDGAWYYFDAEDNCVVAVYKFQNALGGDAYSVTWFIKDARLEEIELGRFLSLESAERHIVAVAPMLGYKMLEDHYRVLLE